MRSRIVLANFGWWCLIAYSTIGFAQDFPKQFPDALQQMFEQFAKESNRFMPGFMGEIPAEELARLERINVSVAEENRFGQQVLDGYLEQLRKQNKEVVQRGRDVEYLVKLANTLKPLMNHAKRYRQLDIRVVQTQATDAYSIPGGHLIFTSGLLADVQSEAALVGVIAHELAHLDRGHQLIALKQSKSGKQTLDFRNGMLAIAIMARPARPEYEKEADADAVRWMIQAGYAARELAHLLAHWDQRQDQQTPWMNMMPPFIRSHPDPGRRAQAIVEQAGRITKNGGYIGRKNLDQRIPRAEQEFTE